MTLSGDEFRELVQREQAMVFSIALRITGDRGTAEEVAQDVFLELYRTEPSLEGEQHLRYWLRRVAAHRAIDQVRRAQGRPEQAAEIFEEERWGGPEEFFSVPVEVAARLEGILLSLPEMQRAIVVLRFQEEMEPAEIATLLAMPVATVKSHLQRALQMARRKAMVVLKEYVRE